MAAIKLAAIFAFLMLLMAAEASIYRTTITTFEIRNDGQSQCRKQIKGQHIDACRSFLRSTGGQQQLLLSSSQQDECCRQLKKVDKECRCDIVEKLWGEMQQEAQEEGGRQQETVKKMAQALPAMCGMEPQVCQFSD